MISLSTRVSLLLLLGGIGCVDDPSLDEAPEYEEPSDGKGDIYGVDSRREVFDANVSTAHRQAARATAVAIDPSSILDISSVGVTVTNVTHEQRMRTTLGGPLCASERFRTQPAPGYCSAFLIAPDLLATAGHCVNRDVPWFRARFLFGFTYDAATDTTVRSVPRADVYEARAVVGHRFNFGEGTGTGLNTEMWEDWAIVQLDRPVTGRTPLVLRSAPVIKGEGVAAIGHPSGIPTKVTRGAVVDATKASWVNTDIDVYKGNSGSAVVDATGAAVGIAIRGSGGDSYRKTAEGCYVSRHCDAVSGSTCIGNHVLRNQFLRPFLDASVRRVIAEGAITGTPGIPDGNLAGVTATRTVTTTGAVAYLTLNVNLNHPRPTDLELYLEHDGKVVAVSKRPQVWAGGRVNFSRTTEGFNGLTAGGEWRLRVVDVVANTGAAQNVEWWQLVIGVRG